MILEDKHLSNPIRVGFVQQVYTPSVELQKTKIHKKIQVTSFGEEKSRLKSVKIKRVSDMKKRNETFFCKTRTNEKK